VEKRILFIVTGFIAGTAISLLVYYNLTGLFPDAPLLALLTSGGGVSGLLLQSVFYIISKKINAWVLWQEQFSLRFIIDFIFNGLTGVLFSGVILMVVLKVSTQASLSSIWETNWQGFAVLWILTIVFVILYNIITLVLYAYYHYAEGQISNIKKERKQLKLQYEALKNQLSPHYLFNSLNTISSLIHKDKASAEEFIRRLADTYQYILKRININWYP
jgi:two-component system LytT family sensor kinase